jgi:hypothetical protein
LKSLKNILELWLFLFSKYVTHYWRLESQFISIYESFRLEEKLKEILLSNIKRVIQCGLTSYSMNECINNQKCLYMLCTDEEAFFCGMANADLNQTMNVLARNFFNIFKIVHLPYSAKINKKPGSFSK